MKAGLGWALIIGCLIKAIIGIAQAQTDPRMADATIQALQAQLAYAQQMMRVRQEDQAALIKQLCEAIPEDKLAGLPACKEAKKERAEAR